MELVAHRGCAAHYPENTKLAVREATRRLPAVEVDVRRCGSGELIAFHDETLDRVTSATGPVAETSWRELQRLDVLGSGESIPRLSALLETVPDGVTVQLEVKERGLAAETYRLAADAGVDVRFSSFRPEILAEIRAVAGTAAMGYLFREDPTDNLARAIDLDCTHVHPHYDCCMETDVVDRANANGLDVVAWKAARTESDVTDLLAAGVDGVTTDRHDIVPPALEQIDERYSGVTGSASSTISVDEASD